MKYIHFTKWEEFQQNKYRNNPWIRLYTDLTDEYDKEGKVKRFFGLCAPSKLTFFLLLCLANKFSNNIPYKDDKQLRRLLGISKFKLEELIECNYIVISSDDCDQQSSQLQNNCLSTVTVTETVTEVKNSAFALPDKDIIDNASEPMINDLIDNLAEELYQKKIFPDAPKFKNTMKKAAKNPRAMLHTLIRVYIKRPPLEKIWGYCVQILKTENGNYNERDHLKSA